MKQCASLFQCLLSSTGTDYPSWLGSSHSFLINTFAALQSTYIWTGIRMFCIFQWSFTNNKCQIWQNYRFIAAICYSPFDIARMAFRQWKLNETYCSKKIHTCTADISHRHTCEFYPLKCQLQKQILLPLLVPSINIRRIYHTYHNWTFSENQEVCWINLKIFIALPVQSTYIIKFKLDNQSYHKNRSGMHVKMQTLGSLTLISC